MPETVPSMAGDVALVIATLGDIMRAEGGELLESNREALEWAISELQSQPYAGQWTVVWGQVRNERGEVVASVPYTLGDGGDRATANLIAAAPALLGALEGLLALPTARPEARKRAEQAIRLAREGTVWPDLTKPGAQL